MFQDNFNGSLQGEADRPRWKGAWVWSPRWCLHSGLSWSCNIRTATHVPSWGMLLLHCPHRVGVCWSVWRIFSRWLSEGEGIHPNLHFLSNFWLRHSHTQGKRTLLPDSISYRVYSFILSWTAKLEMFTVALIFLAIGCVCTDLDVYMTGDHLFLANLKCDLNFGRFYFLVLCSGLDHWIG